MYKAQQFAGNTVVLRFIGSCFGAIFTMVTMGMLFAALTVGGIFYMYSRDLPSSDSLANYAPPTISRIYSAEGAVMDEFATERRIFVPIDDIPALVKDAFISAEDKHFYTHAGYDVEGMIAAARDAIVTVYSSLGQRVANVPCADGTQQTMLHLSGLAAGPYLVRYTSGTTQFAVALHVE